MLVRMLRSDRVLCGRISCVARGSSQSTRQLVAYNRVLTRITLTPIRAGARVGGLGNMPGWWFTIESTTSKHFIQQLKTAVENALRSKPDVRSIMRARATKQRFPVCQWVEDLEKLQSSAIEISHKQAAREKRPTFDSPSTPMILVTPGLLSVLQSRFKKPSLRPRPTVVQGPNLGRSLTTILEGRQDSDSALARDQARALGSFSEGRLLARSRPGLGSKTGPSSRRKAPPPLVISDSSNPVVRKDFTAVRGQTGGHPVENQQRAPLPRFPSASDIRTKCNISEQDTANTLKRPSITRSETLPHLRPNDKKAVKFLGMQLSASRASQLMSPTHSPSSSDGNSTQPASSPEAPLTPSTGYYTPPVTPTPPPSRMSTAQMSFQSNSTAATSVSGVNSVGGDSSDGTPISIKVAKPSGAVKVNTIHTPHAVDWFPSLGPHYFPHGGIPALSTSDVKEEKPDNILQNVKPFFSDPEQEYEAKFKQKLKRLNGKNSEDQLCIEEYLSKSEKSWFGKLRAAELRKSSVYPMGEQPPEVVAQKNKEKKAREDEFGIRKNHKPPTGIKRILCIKFGDWPVYSFLLAFVR